MNRVIARSRIVLILVLVLAVGSGFFVGEYFARADSWVLSAGSPHIYNAANIGCGLITDREGVLLVDLTGERTYSTVASLRMGSLHWVGDRQGNISAPALSCYSQQIAGFDPVSGLYAFGGTGGRVTMSLSARVQAAAVEAMGSYKGTIAVYNYKTGEILCAVSTPTFDPDNMPDILGDETGSYEGVFVNRFTQSTFVPGSIYKIVTAAAALEAIPDIQQQTFTCTGVQEYPGDYDVTCLHVHGQISFRDAFAQSCNCAFAQIADQLGGETLQRYAELFGLTSQLQFDGVTTAAGNIEAVNVSKVSVAWSAVGQYKDTVNPCAFMRFMGTIAGDGIGANPYVVSGIQVGNTTTYTAQTQRTERMLTTQTAQILQEMMRNNVLIKYGAENFPGLTVCAKSGTAEVGGDKKPNAMFAGFVDDEAYPLAFIVAVEDGGYGREICVPILSRVLAVCKEVMDDK